MLTRLTIFTVVLASVYCVDHNIFKNCSQTFCNSLRTLLPDENNKYTADIESATIKDGAAEISLNNNDNSRLKLKLWALNDNKFRLIIEEESSTRYHLTDVLDGEPQSIGVTLGDKDDEKLTISDSNNENKVVIYKSSLKIELYKKDSLQSVIDGNRLTVKNDDSKAFAFAVSFPSAIQLYGIHEHCDSLALQNTSPGGVEPYRLRNLDVPGYETGSTMANYGAIPVLYGHGLNSTSGIFLHNAAEEWVEISNDDSGSSAYFMVESGALDLFVLLGPTPKDVVRQYTNLTGVAHLPQLWALGYHQCRWNYDNTSDVKNVIDNFDSHNFPMDVIWLDIEYTDGKKYFTWNPNTFADHVDMQNYIDSTGRKLVTIIDPHIKVDESYPVYVGAKEKDLFVKNADGSNFEGDCWPGLSSYMDFLNPDARDYYASWYSYEKFNGSTPTLGGIWNDMNEPSVFDDSKEKTMPGDAVHHGGVAHRDIHNIYGLLHTKSTHQGLLQRDNGEKRPFVLSRSHFAGTQRYSGIWTGDNDASWGYLAASYAECLNANILGIVYCGADVGGFTNNPTVELLQRWYQAAAWTPFYRQHANLGTPRREPYLYDEDVQKVIRDALMLRYKHLPTWYTLFYEHTRNGDPVIKPLFYQYPSDKEVIKIDNQLLLGSDILVRAVTEPEVTSVDAYLPDENCWYSIHNSDVFQGKQHQNLPVDISSIPIFYKSGSIISRKDIFRKSSSGMKDDGYHLVINLNKDNTAVGRLYVDDYTSFAYKDNLDYCYYEFTFETDGVNSKFVISPVDENAKGNYSLTISDIVINRYPNQFKNGKGVYTQNIIRTAHNGGLLSKIHIAPNEKTVIQLP